MIRRLLLLCIALSGATGVWGASEMTGNGFILSVTEENDKFVVPSSDKHYTQGLHLALFWPDEQVPWPDKLLQWIPDFGITGAIHKYGLRAGQEIYTPENITNAVVSTTDRPYAGWLFVALMRENRGVTLHNIPTRDHWEVDLGVIGPWSLADDTQTWFHRLIGSPLPAGWGHQLSNEPGLALRADRQWLLWKFGNDSELNAQFIPRAGISLGNVETSCRLGTQMRVGQHIPDEFAKSFPVAYGWYAFSGLDVRLVGYNAFLEGNSFRSSARVIKAPIVAEFRLGVVLVLSRTQISYTYTYMDRAFKTQDRNDAYGSLNLTYRF